MMKTTPGPFSFINIRTFNDTSNSEVDNSNQIGSREMRENESKVNFFKTHFLIHKAIVVFIGSKKVFTEALILHYFDSKHYILIQTDESSFVISEIFCQLTLGYVIYINLMLSTSKIS